VTYSEKDSIRTAKCARDINRALGKSTLQLQYDIRSSHNNRWTAVENVATGNSRVQGDLIYK